ncbi:hypothetical protein SRHO_G00150370 [Serrasalmus rhombeus]
MNAPSKWFEDTVQTVASQLLKTVRQQLELHQGALALIITTVTVAHIAFLSKEPGSKLQSALRGSGFREGLSVAAGTNQDLPLPEGGGGWGRTGKACKGQEYSRAHACPSSCCSESMRGICKAETQGHRHSVVN